MTNRSVSILPCREKDQQAGSRTETFLIWFRAWEVMTKTETLHDFERLIR